VYLSEREREREREKKLKKSRGDMDPTRKWHSDNNGPDKIPVCLSSALMYPVLGFVLCA